MNFKAGWRWVIFIFGPVALGVFSVAVAPAAGGFAVTPTPVASAANPAEIGWFQLGLSMTQGAVFVLVVFLLVGVYLAARKITRGE